MQRQDSALQFGWNTIIHQGWETSDEITEVRVFQIQTDTRSTLTDMGLGFLSAVEVQAFANIKHIKGGKLLSPHIHGLIVGHNIRELAEETARKREGRFQSRFEGMTAIDVDWLSTDIELAHAIAYMLKLSPYTKTYYRSPKGRDYDNLHESEKGDRYIRYLRLMQIQSMLDLRRIVYAGGLLREIRAQGLRDVSSYLATKHVRGQSPVHPDGLPAFWEGLWEELREPRFKQPVIAYR